MARDTNEDLIRDLVHAHQKSDKEALTKEEYEEIGDYNAYQFDNRFGSWTEAKKKAGVPRVKPGDRNEPEIEVTREEIIEDMKEVADHGVIKQADYQRRGNHSMQTFYDRFDSWQEALDESGLESGAREPKITEEQLKEEIRKEKTLTEIAEEYDYSSINTISQRIKNYDWSVRNKLASPSDPNNKSRILSVNADDIEESGYDPSQQLYYSKEVKDGKIVIDISSDRVAE